MSRQSVFMSRHNLIKAKSFYLATEYSCVVTELYVVIEYYYVVTESSRT